jgi:V/A-type H+-transporting ATPase subunit E
MQEEAQLEIEKQRNIFQSSLYQACKQALDALKQNIEEKLFNRELFQLLSKHVQDARVLAQLITAIVKAVEKEGLDADLSVLIPASVPARDVNALLLKDVLDKLKEKSVLVGPLTGGIEVKLRKENLIIDFSDIALKELVAGYIRKDFREILFGIT